MNGETIGSVVRVEVMVHMATEARLNLVRVQSPMSVSDGIRRDSGAHGMGYGVGLRYQDDAACLKGFGRLDGSANIAGILGKSSFDTGHE